MEQFACDGDGGDGGGDGDGGDGFGLGLGDGPPHFAKQVLTHCIVNTTTKIIRLRDIWFFRS